MEPIPHFHAFSKKEDIEFFPDDPEYQTAPDGITDAEWEHFLEAYRDPNVKVYYVEADTIGGSYGLQWKFYYRHKNRYVWIEIEDFSSGWFSKPYYKGKYEEIRGDVKDRIREIGFDKWNELQWSLQYEPTEDSDQSS